MRQDAAPLAARSEERAEKDLLRFITCGSVDDGKSTLIGRLLHDSAVVHDDQLAAVRHDSARFGTTGEDMDLALLVDGLESEREQGITIDVAYRYFGTEKRKFIVADTPGHDQFTRNMATGASTADLAILLVDATKRVLPQTRRHAYISTLLGIRHLVLAVNKMDLVGWSEERFDVIVDDFARVLAGLGRQDVQLTPIPLSALTGDNVVRPSQHLDWYDGPTLMEHLETTTVVRASDFADLRYPVQYVTRQAPDFRGYAGTLASGTIRAGDEVMVLPSRRRSRVKAVLAYEGELASAFAPQAVTITLADEVDVARGDMIVHPDKAPTVDDAFEATVVWMADEAMRLGKHYDLKLGPRTTQATVTAIFDRRDMETLESVPAGQLELNDIGTCALSLASKVAFDVYDTLPATGAFILIDRVTNATVGAGMVRRARRIALPDRATNVTWQDTNLTKAFRAGLKNQRPCVLWFTGLSGAGKSTIANALEQRLAARGLHTYLLDGDNVRHGLNRDLGFSDQDRIENIRRIGEVAKLFVDAGLIVITAFISPFRSDRQLVRDLLGEGEFLEVFIDTPLEVAERRDPKGLYAKARAGKIRNFTGIDSPYERPQGADVHLKTADRTVEEVVEELLETLQTKGAL